MSRKEKSNLSENELRPVKTKLKKMVSIGSVLVVGGALTLASSGCDTATNEDNTSITGIGTEGTSGIVASYKLILNSMQLETTADK